MRHSVAGIVIQDGRYLVARRLPGGSMGGKWEFPGGKVEDGESDLSALVREYDEEFAVPVTVGPLVAQTQFEHSGNIIQLNAYRLELNSDTLTLLEHSALDWATLDEIDQLDFADSDRKLLPQLRTLEAKI